MMYVRHDVDVIPTKIMHAIGTLQPGSTGIAGGYPSCTNQFVIKRDTNIRQLLGARVTLPTELDEIDGDLEVYSDSIVKHLTGGGRRVPLHRDGRRRLRRPAGPRSRAGARGRGQPAW